VTNPLLYTDVELESYIPAGWVLDPRTPPGWDEGGRSFRLKVLDGSELDWEIRISAKDAAAQGRIGALKAAVDRLNRERFASFL